MIKIFVTFLLNMVYIMACLMYNRQYMALGGIFCDRI